jgi:hypothetical protein
MADLDAWVLTAEMVEVFNAWLRSNDQKEWSKETFGPRFAQHSETAAASGGIHQADS